MAAIFQQHLNSAVVIEIGQSKSSAVLDEIKADNSGNVRKRSVVVIQIENIPLEPAPGPVRTNQFVNGIPSQFVSASRARIIRRIGHHLAPEETIQISAIGTGDHPVGNIKIRETIVIEIPSVAGPCPAAYRSSGARSFISEFMAT